MEEIRVNQTNEIIYKEVLSNGLSVYLYPNKNVKNFYLSLTTKFGAKDTKFRFAGEEEYREIPNGLAHFLEHITFHLDGKEANDLFSPYGAYINAFTNFIKTSYIVECNTGFNECLDNLLYYVYTPYYTDKTVDNEKGIIKEESKRGDDDPNRVFYRRRMQSLFKNLKYREKIVGELEEIDSITLQNINDAYKYFYHPGNMYLVISGNFETEDAMKVINERLNQFDFGDYKEAERFKIEEPDNVNEPEVREKGNILNNKTAYMIKVPLKNLETTRLSRVEYTTYLDLILEANLSETSLYYDELLKKDIAPFASGVYTDIMDDYLTINVVNSPKDGKIDEFIDITNKYINKLEINEDDIRRKIKAKTADYILSFDDNETVIGMISTDIMFFDEYQNDFLNILKSFTTENGQKIIDSIDFNNKSIVVMEPNNK